MAFQAHWCRIAGIAIMIGGLACSKPQGRPAGFGVRMYTLHIALHDGFRGNHVTIQADGRSVYDKTGVTTNLSISRADAFDVTLSAKTVRLDVSVEPTGSKGSTTIDVTEYPFVGVSLSQDGSISFQPSKAPFRYM
jgi:uncharacterized protein YcfJ